MLNSLRLSTTRLSASGGPIYATNSTMTATNFHPEISLSVLKCYSDETLVVGAVDEGVDVGVLHNKLEETTCAPLAILDDSTISIETCDSSVTSVDLDDDDCDASVVEVKSTDGQLGVFPAGRQMSAGSVTSVNLDDDDCDASVVEVKSTDGQLGVFSAGCQMSAGSMTSGDFDAEYYDMSANADLDVAPIGHELSSFSTLMSAKLDDDECDSSLVLSDESIFSTILRPKLLAIRTSDELIDNERMKQLLPWEFTHPTDLSGRQGTDFAPGSELFSIFGASRVSLETYMTRMGELCGGPLGQRLEDVMDGEKEESGRPYWGRRVVSPIRPGPQSNTSVLAGRRVEFMDVCEESFVKSGSCCLPVKNALRKLGRRLCKSSLKKAARQRVLEQLASESFQPMFQSRPTANIAPTSAHITVSNDTESETQHLGDDHLCSEYTSFVKVPDSSEGGSECCSDVEVRLSSECRQGDVDQIDFSQENGEGFTEGCSEDCSEVCSESCGEGCSQGCSEGCSVGCIEGCSEVCSESCGEGFSEGCSEDRVRHADKIQSLFAAAKRKIQKLKVMFRRKAVV